MEAEEGVGREAMGAAGEGGDRRQVEVPAAVADADVGPTLIDRTTAMATSMATMMRSGLESVRVGVRREVRVWVRVRVEWRQRTCD